MKKITILTVIILLPMSNQAFAYIGPGLGGGVIAGVLGVVSVIILTLLGILYYPAKRLIKKRWGKK